MLPLFWFPRICPFAAMVVHRKGKSATRRSAGLSRHHVFLRSSILAQLPPCSLVSRSLSAPVKISCQRRPSEIMRTTTRVFRPLAGVWADAKPEFNTQKQNNHAAVHRVFCLNAHPRSSFCPPP